MEQRLFPHHPVSHTTHFVRKQVRRNPEKARTAKCHAGTRMRRVLGLSLLVMSPCLLRAQTPPCGVAIIQTAGPNTDERFVAAPPEQVKAAFLKALPALGAKVHKDEGFHIEAEIDTGLRQALQQKNKDSGVRGKYAGLGALGKFTMDLREETRDGVKGSLLHIEFHKNGFVGRLGGEGYAQPLAEETACLTKLLSTNDPASNPRGLEIKDAGQPHPVTLPDNTPLKVLLRDPLYSKKLDKDSTGKTVNFEVAVDVVVDGSILVRRGALATGHLTNVQKTKKAGRHAAIEFAFDSVTAVDGQKVPVSAPNEQARGGRHSQAMSNAEQVGILTLFVKGTDVFIRAGTTYDLEVAGPHTVQTGQ
jgi:hypothetical protein